jgi:threonine dehydrogenase-like Zn-dependent dehydrogenase
VTETYKRAVFVGPREVRLDELPIPEPGPRQALVKVKACALCTWEQRLFGGEERVYPLAGGHEVSGELVKLGSQVYMDVKIGDRVMASPLTRCGFCESCRRGLDSNCDNTRKSFRETEVPGPAGLAEYILLDDYQLYKASNTVSFEEICLSEPLGCVIRSTRKARVKRADNVVVVGAGIMGMLHLNLCKRLGARVIVSELDAGRAAQARKMGADEIIDAAKESFVDRVKELTAERGADVIFCAVSVASPVEQAVEAVAKGGSVMVYASIHPRTARIIVDPNLFHSKEITLTGTVSQSKEDVLEAVRMISGGIVDMKPLISLTFPFARLEEALHASLRRDLFRVLVTM